MNGTAYLRHPLTLLTAVSLIVGLLWYVLGLPIQMPRSPLAAGEKHGCISYAPAALDEDEQADIPLARIETEIAALARHAS